MKKCFKKVFAVALAAILSLQSGYFTNLNGFTAYADEEEKAEFVIVDGVLTQYNGVGGTVVIPDNVIEIGERAFPQSEDVTDVVIPSSVKKIGDYAFAYTGIESFKVPDTVESIGRCAFGSVDRLAIPDNVTVNGSPIDNDAYSESTVYCTTGGNVEKALSGVVSCEDINLFNIKSGDIYYSVYSHGNSSDSADANTKYAAVERVEDKDNISIEDTIDGYVIDIISKNAFTGLKNIKSLSINTPLRKMETVGTQNVLFCRGINLKGVSSLDNIVLGEKCTAYSIDLSGIVLEDYSGILPALTSDRVDELAIRDTQNLDFSTLKVESGQGSFTTSFENITFSQKFIDSLAKEYTVNLTLSSTRESRSVLTLLGDYPIHIDADWNLANPYRDTIRMEACEDDIADVELEVYFNQRDVTFNITPKNPGTKTFYIYITMYGVEYKIPITATVTGWDNNPALETGNPDITFSEINDDIAGIVSANGELWKVAYDEEVSDITGKKIADSNVKRYIASDAYVDATKADSKYYVKIENVQNLLYVPEMYVTNNDELYINGSKAVDNVKKADALFYLTKDGVFKQHYDSAYENETDVADYVTNIVDNIAYGIDFKVMYLKNDGSLYVVKHDDREKMTSEPVKVADNVKQIFDYDKSDRVSYIDLYSKFTYLTNDGKYYMLDEDGTPVLIADNVKKVLANRIVVKNDGTTWGPNTNYTYYEYSKGELVKLFDREMVEVSCSTGLYYSSAMTDFLFMDADNTIWKVEKDTTENATTGYVERKVCENSKGFTKDRMNYIDSDGKVGTDAVTKENAEFYLTDDDDLYCRGKLLLKDVKEFRCFSNEHDAWVLIIRNDNTVWMLKKWAIDPQKLLVKISLASKAGETGGNTDGDNSGTGDNTGVSTLSGDANADKKVDLKDAKLVLKLALGISTSETVNRKNADYNNDGKIDLKDAKEILKVALGIKN